MNQFRYGLDKDYYFAVNWFGMASLGNYSFLKKLTCLSIQLYFHLTLFTDNELNFLITGYSIN